MTSKPRFSIRAKVSIMSVISIALTAIALGVFLLVQFYNTSISNASNTLSSVANNATLAIDNSAKSADRSMNLLVNQIGYNEKFANNILNADTSGAVKEIRDALGGEYVTGDGSTIIGAMDYLVVNDNDIDDATLYSPYVRESDEASFFNRLKPVTKSKIEFTTEREQQLKDHPGQAIWFFTDDNKLYVWKALVNYGVSDTSYMQVVGYIEYTFNKASFLTALTDTTYENEGMLLFDENGKEVLNISSGDQGVDNKVNKSGADIAKGLKRNTNYTTYSSVVPYTNWKYVAFINHHSIDESNRDSLIITISVVSVSVIVSALVAYLLAAREIKRIKNLSKAASSISSGDYSIRLEKKANDEITDVSESFNSMAGKIQEVLNELIEQQDSISENFATILSNKSGESGNHVKRVSEYSAILAEELGFSKNEVHDIRIASMLHDVGKIMVDESILHKPGRFTDEEYKIMQQHVVYGGQLLKGVPGNIMQLGAIIAEYHHERYDGNGYVKHLKGDEIPKEAQITSVADVFDALVSNRCYKNAWTIEDAYNEIVSQSGKQFAPDVIEAFKRRFEDFKHIAEIYRE